MVDQRPRVQPGPWAVQLATAIRAVGVDFEPSQQQSLCAGDSIIGAPPAAGSQHHSTCMWRPYGGHTKLRNYVNVRGGNLTADSYSPAALLDAYEMRTVAMRQSADAKDGCCVHLIANDCKYGYMWIARMASGVLQPLGRGQHGQHSHGMRITPHLWLTLSPSSRQECVLRLACRCQCDQHATESTQLHCPHAHNTPSVMWLALHIH